MHISNYFNFSISEFAATKLPEVSRVCNLIGIISLRVSRVFKNRSETLPHTNERELMPPFLAVSLDDGSGISCILHSPFRWIKSTFPTPYHLHSRFLLPPSLLHLIVTSFTWLSIVKTHNYVVFERELLLKLLHNFFHISLSFI